jgi:hypothetical protein
MMGATTDVINSAIALVAYSVDDNDGRLECLTPKRDHVLALYAALKKYDAKVRSYRGAVLDDDGNLVKPSQCRNRLRDEGKPHPKSGC